MPVSQNLHFTATVPEDEETCGPPGEFLVVALARELAETGWTTGGMDDPPDYGWSVECCRDSSKLEVVVSQIEEGRWILQVSPKRRPGLIGKLFGEKPSATPDDVHSLALAVHQVFLKLGYLGSPRWGWDRFPDDENSTPEPQTA